MLDKNMLDYIKMSRAKGQTDEQIKSTLLSGGWQLADIEEALKAFDAAQVNDAGKGYDSSPNSQGLNIDWSRLRPLIVIILVVGAIVMASRNSFHNVHSDIQVNADEVQINHGKLKITAQAMPESTRTFVINSGSGTEFNDGMFAAWTMEQANTLKANYGDFTHCNSPGSSAGMNSLNHIIVFAAEDGVRAKLNNLIKVSLNEPIVELRVCQLNIKGQAYNNSRVVWDQSEQEMYFLVKDVTIIKENYNK